MKNTLKNLQKFGRETLKDLENPRLEADLLLCHVLEITREKLWILSPDEEIPEQKYNKFLGFIKKRKKHIPIAQIIGYKIWKNLRITVDEKVLIPRDETEILVDHIIADIKQNSSPHEVSRDIEPRSLSGVEGSRSLEGFFTSENFTILDVGCGSGCISIFMKKTFPKAEVIGLDISEKALEVSKKNAEKILVGAPLVGAQNEKGRGIVLHKSNLFEVIPANSQIDIIIANLPYVPEDLEVAPDLDHEPALAIFAEDGGLALIKKLKTQIQEKNINFQSLWLEFLPTQAQKIQEIFTEYSVEFFTDEGGEIFFAKINP